MARYPDDPNYPDDSPTSYLGQPPPEDEIPWYRKPAALVAFGALGAVVIALIVYGLAELIAGDSTSETTPTRLTPLTTTSAAVAPPPPRTVTETVTPTTTAPPTTTTTEPTTTTTTTTTTPETTTSVSTSTSTSTVTETVTAPPEG